MDSLQNVGNVGKMLIPSRPYNNATPQPLSAINKEEGTYQEKNPMLEASEIIDLQRSKELAQSRPYNANIPHPTGTVTVEDVKEDQKIPKSEAPGIMNISQSLGKMLIPSRPYNTSLLQSTSTIGLEEVKEEYTIPRQESPNDRIKIEKCREKIKLNKETYSEPVLLTQKEENNQNPSLPDIQKNLQLMRNAVRDRVKSTMIGAMLELSRLDEIENGILFKFTQTKYATSKVKTNIDEFFSKITAEIFTHSPDIFNSSNSKSNAFPNSPQVPDHIQSNVMLDILEKNTSNVSMLESAEIFCTPKIVTTQMNSYIGSQAPIITKRKFKQNLPVLVGIEPPEIMYSKNCTSVNLLNIGIPFTNVMGLHSKNKNLYIISGGGDIFFNYNLKKKKMGPRVLKLPVKKSYFGMSYIGKNFAIFGGISESQEILASVDVVIKNSWRSMSPMIVPRYHCQAIIHQKCTYVFGGITTTGFCSSIEKYDNRWMIIDIEIPKKIIKFGLISYYDNIIIFGGESEKKKERRVFKYEVEKNHFENMIKLSEPFYTNTNAALGVANDRVYLLDSVSKKILEYDLINK